ncbi:unnamed protein product [Blepharisma stoltei]|uniref:Uncharacterized protein n=1 Tax=Blepharisma stoltei TaxID=1481888 RepID=A0AAU9JE32_9CILI|nr:unnamed protein product [Blepharisma stoltei]
MSEEKHRGNKKTKYNKSQEFSQDTSQSSYKVLKISKDHTDRLTTFIKRHRNELQSNSTNRSQSHFDDTKMFDQSSCDIYESIKHLDAKLYSKKIKINSKKQNCSPSASRSISPNPSIPRTPKEFITDIKRLQETLKADINQSSYSAKSASSYSSFMILKKAYEKLEGLEMLSKSLDIRKTQLDAMEKELRSKMKKVKDKDEDLDNREITIEKMKRMELQIAERELQLKEKMRKLEKKEEELYENNENQIEFSRNEKTGASFKENEEFEIYSDIITPAFQASAALKKEQDYSTLESELKEAASELEQRTFDLLKSEEKLAERESILYEQQKELKHKENELKKKEASISDLENKYAAQIDELSHIKDSEKAQLCRIVLDEVILKVISQNLEKQAHEIEAAKFEQQIASEKLQSEFEELRKFREKLENEASKQLEIKLELDKKEKELDLQEKRITEQIRLLGEGKEDEVLKMQEIFISERESALRIKQLKLLEYQESLKEREIEINEREKEIYYVSLEDSYKQREKNIIEKEKEIELKYRQLETEFLEKEKNIKLREKLLAEQESAIEHKRTNVITGWENVLNKFKKIQRNDESSFEEEAKKLKELENLLREKEDEMNQKTKKLDKLEKNIAADVCNLKIREEEIEEREKECKEKTLILLNKEKYLEQKVKEVNNLVLQLNDNIRKANPSQSQIQKDEFLENAFETCQPDNNHRLSKILFDI